jgi:hypothetical protein
MSYEVQLSEVDTSFERLTRALSATIITGAFLVAVLALQLLELKLTLAES